MTEQLTEDLTDMSSSKITHAIVMVTPDMAERWLLANTHNRKVRQQTVARYRADMEAGLWTMAADPIRFDRDGRLSDGTTTARLSPAAVTGLSGIRAIQARAGSIFTLAPPAETQTIVTPSGPWNSGTWPVESTGTEFRRRTVDQQVGVLRAAGLRRPDRQRGGLVVVDVMAEHLDPPGDGVRSGAAERGACHVVSLDGRRWGRLRLVEPR